MTQERSMLISRDVPLNPGIHARWLSATIGEMTPKTDCIIKVFVQTGLIYMQLGIKSKLLTTSMNLWYFFWL